MTQSNAEIAVWEDDPSGHRLPFVEILLSYIFENTGRPALFITCREALDSEMYRNHLKGLEDRFELFVVGERTHNNRLDLARRFFSLSKALRRRNIRRLLAPTSDRLVQVLGVSRLLGYDPSPLEIRCGMVWLTIAYPPRPFPRGLLDRLAHWLKSLAPVTPLYIDAFAVETANRKFGLNLQVLPEPVLFLPTVPSKKSAVPGLCFGILGHFNERKGLDLLFDAFQSAHLPSDTRLLAAGPQSDPRFLQTPRWAELLKSRNVTVIDRTLDQEAYFDALAEMDVVCLPYKSHIGTSGVFAQAAALNKVILASDYGWLASEGRKYGKTRFFANGSVPSLAKALENIAAEYDDLNKVSGNYTPTSTENFAKVLCGFDKIRS